MYNVHRECRPNPLVAIIAESTKSTAGPVIQSSQSRVCECDVSNLVTISVSNRFSVKKLSLDYLLYCCTLIVSDFIGRIVTDFCFCTLFCAVLTPEIKPGFLSAHKPGFAGLKTAWTRVFGYLSYIP